MFEEMFSSSWVPTAILNARPACASEAAAFSPIIIARLSWDLTSSKVVHLSRSRLWTTTCCILAWRDQRQGLEAAAGSVALGPSPSRSPGRKEPSLRLLDLSRDICSSAKGKSSMNIVQCRWLSLVAQRDSK